MSPGASERFTVSMTTTPINNEADRVLLSGRIRHFATGLFFGRARLYHDRIQLRWWTIAGPRKRSVLLEDVVNVDWWTLTNDGPNLALQTNNGARVAFWVKSPGIWRFRILELLNPGMKANSDKRGRFSPAA